MNPKPCQIADPPPYEKAFPHAAIASSNVWTHPGSVGTTSGRGGWGKGALDLEFGVWGFEGLGFRA